ncbi:AI-2E family transporter [Marinicella sp. S1101]|uniref:AI-2E family transporter n=1 Tax=Marinicella marina TaxID=2996016 RepID=UPI002260F01B|nr:AI-2E family transporter [Marinicella marina]MCX7554961.1 AI-2E family transporter [Marinicella marina]MDJ1141571.1 AI-2E family transporter [Marinicella marina]
MNVISSWFKRNFSDPQIVILISALLFGFVFIIYFGRPLAPFLTSIVVAYLLESVILRLEKMNVPRVLAVGLVFLVFLALMMVLIIWLVPKLTSQVSQLAQALPAYLSTGLDFLRTLPEKYPSMIEPEQVQSVIAGITNEMTQWGQTILGRTVSSVFSAFSIAVFLVVMPILVFFLLKDKAVIVAWLRQFIPKDSKLTLSVWNQVDIQIGNYVRGKAFEILLVGLISYIVFVFFDLEYAILLATLTGFSVLVPFIGAVAVTVPIALVAFFQFGWTAPFAYVMISYGVIQMLDGNVLVPWLFSEVNNLHPVAIIVAVLFFGGVWGFWGVFFAIPLATLVNAIIESWPKSIKNPEQEQTAE